MPRLEVAPRWRRTLVGGAIGLAAGLLLIADGEIVTIDLSVASVAAVGGIGIAHLHGGAVAVVLAPRGDELGGGEELCSQLLGRAHHGAGQRRIVRGRVVVAEHLLQALGREAVPVRVWVT